MASAVRATRVLEESPQRDDYKLITFSTQRSPLATPKNQQLRTATEEHDIAREHELVLSNLFVVEVIAKKYYSLNKAFVQLEDLIAAGYEGLVVAVKRFDPKRGVQFKTYASWWIRNRIGREIRHSRWIIDIPERDYRRVLKLLKVVRILRQGFGREPTAEEIAKYMDIPCSTARHLLRWTSSDVLSLDMPVGEDGISTLADFITDRHCLWRTADGQTERSGLADGLAGILHTLTPREEKIIKMRFGLEDGSEYSLEEIGQSFAITRERVRQIEAKAMRKLRHPSRSRKLAPFLDIRVDRRRASR